ncbi:MAG TPA: hypothetical protein VF422_01100, partial [Dokdonella sp.]
MIERPTRAPLPVFRHPVVATSAIAHPRVAAAPLLQGGDRVGRCGIEGCRADRGEFEQAEVRA